MGQWEWPTGRPGQAVRGQGLAGGRMSDGEGRSTELGGQMGLSHSSPSSPPNALAFHHEACGGARIISVTAVTAPCVRSFTTLYTLLKKLFLQTTHVVGWLFSSSGCCCLAGAAAPTGNWAGAAEELGLEGAAATGSWGSTMHCSLLQVSGHWCNFSDKGKGIGKTAQCKHL